MNTRTALLAALALLSSTSGAQTLVDRAARDELAHMSSEEPVMRQAFEKARATLDDFLRKAAAPPAGTARYALKVAVSDGKNTEYFWVNNFAAQGQGFVGDLANEPRMVKKYKNGERFAFARAQIADWTYVDQSTKSMIGNFTACALLTKESPADREAFKRQYGFKCE
jgi:uncharacterized protein YegJ (DUF2314 family)